MLQESDDVMWRINSILYFKYTRWLSRFNQAPWYSLIMKMKLLQNILMKVNSRH